MLRVAALLIAFCTACGPGEAPPRPGADAGTGSGVNPASDRRDPLRVRGRQIYMSTCTACHNPDPTKVGSLGPEIAGTSRELVEAKVLRNEYPEGYRPKRETRVMVPLKHLEPEIDALVAFLAEAAAS